jgi:hypothetical protein
LKKLSVGALSQLIEQRIPYAVSLRWKSWLAYWAHSTGRRNTFNRGGVAWVEVEDGDIS